MPTEDFEPGELLHDAFFLLMADRAPPFPHQGMGGLNTTDHTPHSAGELRDFATAVRDAFHLFDDRRKENFSEPSSFSRGEFPVRPKKLDSRGAMARGRGRSVTIMWCCSMRSPAWLLLSAHTVAVPSRRLTYPVAGTACMPTATRPCGLRHRPLPTAGHPLPPAAPPHETPSARREFRARAACWGTTLFPRRWSCAARERPSVSVTHPAGRPIIHSTKWAESRRVPGWVGGGEAWPVRCSQRWMARW